MRKLFLGAVVALLLVAEQAHAAIAPVGLNVLESQGVKLSAVAANAAAGTRTFTVANPKGAFGMMVVHLNFTRSSATAVTMVCSESPDAGSTLYALHVGETSSGVQTTYPASKTTAVSASAKWPWRWNIKGFSFISCVYSTTSGGAGDLLTATVDLVAP